MSLKPTFTPAANIKLMMNIGALMDIPTGFYVTGKYGQQVLLGGLGFMTGIVGTGNMFKSTILDYMMLSAAERIYSTVETSMGTYDTEMNIHEERKYNFTQQFDGFKGKNILEDGTWVITDKTIYLGDKYYEVLKKYLQHKKEVAKSYTHGTPFLSRDNKTPLRCIVPTFGAIDSFSVFETSDVQRMQNENELGESGGNTIHMRQGLAKLRLLMDLPTHLGTVNHYMLMTGQYGKDAAMAIGPYAAPPSKKLQHMKPGEKVIGVTGKFFFLMNNCWHACGTSVLSNSTTKAAEYPVNPDDNESGDTDLNLVTLRQLRSKSGQSGITIQLVVSQSQGVLPSLTEFHFIKEHDRFGISGTLQHYNLDLLPEVKISRTTVRSKLDENPKLRRAMNITSELLQMQLYHRQLRSELMSPKEIIESLTKQGYDWDSLLTTTRSWWAFEGEKHPLYDLSTYDIVKMARGTYIPYWLEADKKTIKKDFVKKST